jgi:hypothetical protein
MFQIEIPLSEVITSLYWKQVTALTIENMGEKGIWMNLFS